MDNQKPVLQVKPQQVNRFYIVVFVICTISISTRIGVFNSLPKTICLIFALLSGLFLYLYKIKKSPKMDFSADGKIIYNEETFNVNDYLGITTVNNLDTNDLSQFYYGIKTNNQVVLINKDKLAKNLTVFDIPVPFVKLNENAEFYEIVQLKKQIAQATHLPIFEPCHNFILRDSLTLWQEKEEIDHLIAYQNNQREIILICCFVATAGLVFSVYEPLFIIATMFAVGVAYLLLDKYRFYISTITPSEIKISNEKILYNNQEIVLNDIKKVEIKDIYSQKYYIYSRLNIELNNGEIIKLFVSTPQVRNPEKLRQFLSEKLPNKLIDEDKIS